MITVVVTATAVATSPVEEVKTEAEAEAGAGAGATQKRLLRSAPQRKRELGFRNQAIGGTSGEADRKHVTVRSRFILPSASLSSSSLPCPLRAAAANQQRVASRHGIL